MTTPTERERAAEAIAKLIGEIESRVAGECLDSLPEKEWVLEKDIGYHGKDCCEESWRWNEAGATLKAVTKKYLWNIIAKLKIL